MEFRPLLKKARRYIHAAQYAAFKTRERLEYLRLYPLPKELVLARDMLGQKGYVLYGYRIGPLAKAFTQYGYMVGPPGRIDIAFRYRYAYIHESLNYITVASYDELYAEIGRLQAMPTVGKRPMNALVEYHLWDRWAQNAEPAGQVARATLPVQQQLAISRLVPTGAHKFDNPVFQPALDTLERKLKILAEQAKALIPYKLTLTVEQKGIERERKRR